jgi:hypothetical protein
MSVATVEYFLKIKKKVWNFIYKPKFNGYINENIDT